MAALRLAHPCTPTVFVDLGPAVAVRRSRSQWDAMRRHLDLALSVPQPVIGREIVRLESR